VHPRQMLAFALQRLRLRLRVPSVAPLLPLLLLTKALTSPASAVPLEVPLTVAREGEFWLPPRLLEALKRESRHSSASKVVLVR